MTNRSIFAVFGIGIAAVVAGAALIVACSPQDSIDPCKIHPTRTAASGEWVEYDGEPLDDDPCDADDLFEVDRKKTPAKKTTPGKTPSRKLFH